jgi:sulfite reductase (NADPH) flavoprotein alpha-component
LQNKDEFQAVLPLYKIDNSDFTDFQKWAKKWSGKTEIPLQIEPPKQKKKLKQFSFEVIQRTELNVDNTFLLQLKPKRNVKFTSGDLLSIFPNGSEIARQYSIARMGDEILLSIKKHEFGKGSSFLFDLKKGDIIKAAIEINANFHFPKKTNSAVLIANGTGIAPFLGMIAENRNTSTNLLWGGRTQNSSTIYDSILEIENLKNHDVKIQKCFSREENKQYVQDLVIQQTETILQNLETGGAILICGSLSMQHGVLEVLEEMLIKNSDKTLDVLIHNGQLKMDCY